MKLILLYKRMIVLFTIEMLFKAFRLKNMDLFIDRVYSTNFNIILAHRYHKLIYSYQYLYLI